MYLLFYRGGGRIARGAHVGRAAWSQRDSAVVWPRPGVVRRFLPTADVHVQFNSARIVVEGAHPLHHQRVQDFEKRIYW